MIFVDGDTTQREVTLLEGEAGSQHPMDLTGATVALLLRNVHRVLVIVEAGITILDAAGGKIGYGPNPAQLNAAAAPYSARWRVTTADEARICPFPDPDTWEVKL
jgi:hypothetical protein